MNIQKDIVSLCICLIIFVSLSWWGLMNVGPYYDELLHAVAAQKMIVGSSYVSQVHHVVKIDVAGHTIPLMILYYVGPLKTYAIALAFYFFPMDLLTLRLFTILCALITLTLTFVLARQYLSKSSAMLSSLMLATDPSFVLAGRYDWGPTAVQNVIKMISLLIVFSLKREVTNRKIVSLGIVAGLLIWDKLNAIWYLVPLALLVMYILHSEKNKIKVYLLLLFSFLIGAFPFLIVIVKRPFFYSESQKSFTEFEAYYREMLFVPINQNITTLLKNYSSNFGDKADTLFKTLNGTSIIEHVLSTHQHATGIFGYVLAIIVLISVAVGVQKVVIKKHSISFSFEFKALLSICAFIIAFIAITPHANGPHHMLMLYPFIQMCASELLLSLKVHKKIICILILSLISANVLALYSFNQATAKGELKTFWKPVAEKSLVGLENYKKVISLDWGITLPIGFTTKGKIKVEDLQAFYEAKCKTLKEYIIEKEYSVILYETQNQVFSTYYSKCIEQRIHLTEKPLGNYVLYTNNK